MESPSPRARCDNEKAKEVAPYAETTTNDESQSTTGWRFWLVLLALLLSMFLVALDMTIVATAIPKITDEYHRLEDIGWYGSAFFLTLAVFQSFWGKAYKYFSLKYTFFAAICLFELGSLVCGAAPNSIALIIGRAITGLGGAGITGGCYVIIAFIASDKNRPTYMGLLGVVFSVASVAGPLLGGVFADDVSWRWCFYINLPIGGCTLAILLFFFRTPAAAAPAKASFTEILLQFDLLSTIVIIGALVCYILALQWGGISKPWSDSSVIGTLVGSGVLTITFGVLQYWQKERALVAPRILRSKIVFICSLYIFFMNAANFLILYYLPIYFQAVDGASPAMSGVRNLALIMSSSIATLISSHSMPYVKYFKINLIVGSVFLVIGAGLLYTLDIGTSTGQYIGYQIIFGVGVGISIQVPVITAQAFSAMEDIAQTTATVLFFQMVSGALSVSAAQSIFENQLLGSLARLAPETPASLVLKTGASDLRATFTGAELLDITKAYMVGLEGAWAAGIALAGVSLFVALLASHKRLPSATGGTEAV